VIAILASEWDEASRALVHAWRGEGAVLIGARDLCTRGWVWGDRPGRFVADRRVHRTADLQGVLVRRPALAAEELLWMAEADRDYACAEINAFLVAWLHGLACPVLNRPTANALCGPAWSQRQWQQVAARAGVPWSRKSVDEAQAEDLVFCGTEQHGALTPRRLRAGRALLAASGTTLLGLRFVGDALAAVTTQPALAEGAVRAMVLRQFVQPVHVLERDAVAA
jgi:hypothetical protein